MRFCEAIQEKKTQHGRQGDFSIDRSTEKTARKRRPSHLLAKSIAESLNPLNNR